jgi:hypothetical protein
MAARAVHLEKMILQAIVNDFLSSARPFLILTIGVM